MPKPGERVRVDEINDDEPTFPLGSIGIVREAVPGESPSKLGYFCVHLEGINRGTWCRVSPVGEAVDRTKAPDPLPDVLPAGTRWSVPRLPDDRGVLTTAAKLKGDEWVGNGRTDSGHCRKVVLGQWRRDLIDWPSYYAALAQPVPPATQPVEPERPDPYRVHTVRTCPHERTEPLADICLDCGASGMLIKQVGTATNMLQWSDKQRAKLDQLRAELDRPVRRDAADWEVWSTASWESGS
jgi:hypothetical protein